VKPLYSNIGQLPFWNEEEIEFREMFQKRIVLVLKQTLKNLNNAWEFYRVEGPLLTPSHYVSKEYNDKDVFVTNHEISNSFLCLRAETTASSYEYAKSLNKKLPLCVWQSGKSFRRELGDGATAAKLRYNEFYQLEFQCIYSGSTKADYRKVLVENISKEISRFTNRTHRVVISDRIPSYSDSTLDIEVLLDNNQWKEIASCSIRNDFDSENDTKVCEIAIGLDRVVVLSMS
jgi:glycyl-tRNA synthetase